MTKADTHNLQPHVPFSENGNSARMGCLKPDYFRPEPTTRGFSVDRVHQIGAELLKSSKHTDTRYNGYLRFVATRSNDIRRLLEKTRKKGVGDN